MATKHPPVAHPQLHAPQPKKKIAFDINKPIKTGYFMKQGEKHRKFKRRFFVLYHNFLVYYNEDTTWKFDCTKGDSPSVSCACLVLEVLLLVLNTCYVDTM